MTSDRIAPRAADDAAAVSKIDQPDIDGSATGGMIAENLSALNGTTGSLLTGVLTRSADVANPQDTGRRRTGSGSELAGQFAAVARALESEPSVEATLQRTVEIARLIVPGCHHAGITVLRRGKPETPAATDAVSAAVDAVQYEAGEGPCLSAILDDNVFRTGDLARETRWPKFSGPAVQRTGVRSVLAYRLFTEEDTLGALNLYSRERDAFGDDSVGIGSILTAHAALAFARARERAQINGLEQAVASNRAIGMAIGILMAIERVGQDEAFDLLRTVSQRTNRKLREIADDVVHTGQLPEPPGK
ncbi:MAG TPA: GAF and ANTAR domain-containing protein [Mycobacteriales bacterium]